jgi:type I restriction enzyme M protein
LERAGIISVATGDEVGKLAYGGGSIPFVRTSDIANWQVKADPKHGLSQALYDMLAERQDVAPEDILMVRDGTYLVGTCAILTDLDSRIVYQSHILKFKVLDRTRIDPYLLLALLSSPIVKRQIYAKRFTQDIIDTLGGRWRELILPVPKDARQRQEITDSARKAIILRREAAELTFAATRKVAPEMGTDIDDDAEYDFGVLNQ